MKFREHEAMCKLCAECCRLKHIPAHGTEVVLDIYCPALDLKTKKCKIYPRRQILLHTWVKAPFLLISQALMLRMAPPSCAYAPAGYEAPEFDPDKLYLVPRREYWYIWIINRLQRLKISWKLFVLKIQRKRSNARGG